MGRARARCSKGDGEIAKNVRRLESHPSQRHRKENDTRSDEHKYQRLLERGGVGRHVAVNHTAALPRETIAPSCVSPISSAKMTSRSAYADPMWGRRPLSSCSKRCRDEDFHHPTSSDSS